MLIITGSGRSGTSAVAKLLHTAGVSVGRDLIEPDEMNADGYFEERAVIDMNQRILTAAGLGPRFSTATRAGLIDAAAPSLDEMRALAEDATPAWKDPRFSWTLEAWLPVLATPPKVVVCLRSPAEVAASTMRYYGVTDDEGRRAVEHLWCAQYERLLDVIESHALDATCVEYAALQSGDGAQVAALASFVGVTLDPAGVRRELKHHSAPVSADMRALYNRVRSLGSRPSAAPGSRIRRRSGGARKA